MRVGYVLAAVAGVGFVTVDASASPRATKLYIVGQAHAGAPWTTAPTQARLSADAKLSVVVRAIDRTRRGRRVVWIADPVINRLIVGRRSISRSQRRGFSLLLSRRDHSGC